MATGPRRLLAAAALLAAMACSDAAQPPPPAAPPACTAAPRATFSAAPRTTASPRAQASALPGSSPSGVTRQLLMGEVVSFKNGDLVVNDRRSGQRVTVAVDSKTQVRTLLTSPVPAARATPAAVPSTPGAGTPSAVTRNAGPAASPVPASSLKPGQTVTVTAAHRADGTLLATAVVIRPPACIT